MAAQPFTTAGVQAKQAELYALSDSQLAAQASQIRNNFKSWMSANFTLDTLQTNSLNNLDPDFLDYISFQVGYAVRHKIPINVDKNGTETTGKLIHSGGNMSSEFGPNGVTVAGSLDITITYST